MLPFTNNMVVRMVSNGCFILLATISLLALPSKADVWTRVAEKIAKEQNPGMGSKTDIAIRLTKQAEIEKFRLWKIEQRKRDLSDSSQANANSKALQSIAKATEFSKKYHVPPPLIFRTARILGKICIGVIVGVGVLSALIGGLFRGVCMFFAHKKDDEMKEEE